MGYVVRVIGIILEVLSRQESSLIRLTNTLESTPLHTYLRPIAGVGPTLEHLESFIGVLQKVLNIAYLWVACVFGCLAGCKRTLLIFMSRWNRPRRVLCEIIVTWVPTSTSAPTCCFVPLPVVHPTAGTVFLLVKVWNNTVEPLSNVYPHQRPSLLYDHISCDGQCFLFIRSLTSDHPSDATSDRVRWNFLPRGRPHRVFQNDCGMNVR